MQSRYFQWLLPQLFFCLNLAGVISYAVTSNSLQASLGLSTAQVGSLGGAYFIAYAISQLILGSSLGAIPPRLMLGFSAILAGLGDLLLVTVHSYEQALFARLLIGIGFGTAMVGVVYVVGRLFSENFALMVNLSQSLANAVGAVLGLLAPLPFFQNFRNPILVIATLLILNGLLILFCLRLPDADRVQSGDRDESDYSFSAKLSAIFGSGQFWLGTVYFAGLFAAFLAYADLWNIKFQVDVFGQSATTAPIMNAGVAAGLTAGGILTGLWAKRSGFLLPARLCSWLALLFMGVLYSTRLPVPVAELVMILLGLCMGAAPLGLAVMNAHVPRYAQPLASPILLTTVFLTGGALMSAVGFSLAALPASAFSTYRAGLHWFLIPIAVAAVASLLMKPGRTTVP